MRMRALARAAALLSTVAVIAIPMHGSAANRPLVPYSDEWLAQNHSRYDTPITARYEALIRSGVGSGLQGPQAGPAVPNPSLTNVRMSNPSFAGAQNEFQISINPNDSRFAVGASNDGRNSGTGYYYTSDYGQTWQAGDMPGIGTSCCDPGVAYAADGTVYFINLDTSPAVVHFMKSTNNGSTWTHVSDVAVVDRPNIAIDNTPTSPHFGRIYITWSQLLTQPYEINLNYSDNGGMTWSAPVNVSHVNAIGASYPQSSNPTVSPDGSVYVGFQYYPNGTFASAENRIAKSTNGGVSFSPNTTITAGPHVQGGLDIGDARGYFAYDASCNTFRHRAFPIIGVNPTNSLNVYAMWAGGNLETTYTCGSLRGWHSDVLFSRSIDGGATWSAPLKVNDDQSGKDQYYPWMDVAPNGTIWVGWHDRRYDPNNRKHVWFVDRSRDGGLTFAHDVRMGNFASLPDFFIGDYASLAATNDLVLSMWWDSRNSADGDPYTAPIRLH
jgi:hypothetical protein